MAINENWNIRSRAHACAHTGKPFAEGDAFHTALLEDPKSGELIRRDYSAGAWEEMGSTVNAFSHWRSEYSPPKSEAKAEVVEKESAADLLRRLVEEDATGTENTRYILAVMLERKRQLRQTGTRETEDDTFLIYENPKSGEVYIIRDPELKLDQIEQVQKEVTLLLGLEAASGETGPVPPPATQAA